MITWSWHWDADGAARLIEFPLLSGEPVTPGLGTPILLYEAVEPGQGETVIAVGHLRRERVYERKVPRFGDRAT